MSDEPSGAVRILTYPIDEAVLKELGNRRRNQLFGCMHAHNELSFLNRLLLFTQNSTADGELHDHAQSIQMWCVLLPAYRQRRGEAFAIEQELQEKEEELRKIEAALASSNNGKCETANTRRRYWLTPRIAVVGSANRLIALQTARHVVPVTRTLRWRRSTT